MIGGEKIEMQLAQGDFLGLLKASPTVCSIATCPRHTLSRRLRARSCCAFARIPARNGTERVSANGNVDINKAEDSHSLVGRVPAQVLDVYSVNGFLE